MKMFKTMKSKIKLFLCILLFHVIVGNDTDNPLLLFEFLMQGTTINSADQRMEFMLYHYILNVGFVILLLGSVLQAVSQAVEMRDYIITRCGKRKFKLVLLKSAFKEIFAILAARQIIYTVYFVYTGKFTKFYFYDMASTFLTLLIFAQGFILLKLFGAKDKVPVFIIAALNMISQMLSYEHPAFSAVVIASCQWQLYWVRNILAKAAVILALGIMIYLQKDFDRMLGVKNG